VSSARLTASEAAPPQCRYTDVFVELVKDIAIRPIFNNYSNIYFLEETTYAAGASAPSLPSQAGRYGGGNGSAYVNTFTRDTVRD